MGTSIIDRKSEKQPVLPDAIWSDVSIRLGFEQALTRLALGAAERDHRRQLLFPEIAQFKALGLPSVRLPAENRGAGISLTELFRLVRDLATADSNIAHALRNHFGIVERHLRTPEAPLSREVLRHVGEGKIFGGAFSEKGPAAAGSMGAIGTRLTRSRADGSYRLTGTKSYCTGNLYADYLFVAALDEPSQEARQIMIPRGRPGIEIPDDWDGFGQKLTGSGSTSFSDVLVEPSEIYPVDRRGADADGLYEFTFHQLWLTTTVSGIAHRIFLDAVELVKTRGRNYYHGVSERVGGEPGIQAVIGQIAAYSRAVKGIVDYAIERLDRAWTDRDAPDAHGRSLAATIAASEAKIFADETTSLLASKLIDLASGSSVSTGRNLDRHWRNIKVLGSHNPRIYKERILGDYYLNGALPPTGAFF